MAKKIVNTTMETNSLGNLNIKYIALRPNCPFDTILLILDDFEYHHHGVHGESIIVRDLARAQCRIVEIALGRADSVALALAHNDDSLSNYFAFQFKDYYINSWLLPHTIHTMDSIMLDQDDLSREVTMLTYLNAPGKVLRSCSGV